MDQATGSFSHADAQREQPGQKMHVNIRTERPLITAKSRAKPRASTFKSDKFSAWTRWPPSCANCVILKIDYFICSKLTLIIFGIQSQIFDFFVKKEKIIIQMILIQQFFWNMSPFFSWKYATFFLLILQLQS